MEGKRGGRLAQHGIFCRTILIMVLGIRDVDFVQPYCKQEAMISSYPTSQFISFVTSQR
jgi:hypothetical protein